MLKERGVGELRQPTAGMVKINPKAFIRSSKRDRDSRKAFFMSPKRIVALLILVVAIVIGWVLYSQSVVQKQADNEVLKGISIDDENYEDMTPEQRDAQLRRQIGHSVTELKEKEMTKTLLRDHKSAFRAAKVLYITDAYTKELQAYAVAAELADSKVDYRFFQQYALRATSQKKYDLAIELLGEAKKRVQSDNSLSEESKAKVIKEITWELEYTKAWKSRG